MQHVKDLMMYVMAKEKVCRTENDCQRDCFQAKERMKLTHPNLMTMIDFSCEDFTDATGAQAFRVTGYYEYLPMDLETDIVQRAKTGAYYTASQLLRMSEGVLSALAYLKSFKMIHSDVRPKYISVPTEDPQGQYKLLDRLGDALAPNKVQVSNFKKSRPLYVSPAFFEAISNSKTKIRHNPYKSDAFSFGLVLLEAGTLKSVQGIYNKQKCMLNTAELVKLQTEFTNRYFDCEAIKQVMFWLLNLDEIERKDAKAVLRAINSSATQLNSSENSKATDMSQYNSQSQSEGSKAESQRQCTDQSVQCDREALQREESQNAYRMEGLLQPKRQNFLKQQSPVVILSAEKKLQSPIKKIVNIEEKDLKVDIRQTSCERKVTAENLHNFVSTGKKENRFSHQQDRNLCSEGKQFAADINFRLREDSSTPEHGRDPHSYSFKDLDAREERVRHTLDAETYNLVRRISQDTNQIDDPTVIPPEPLRQPDTFIAAVDALIEPQNRQRAQVTYQQSQPQQNRCLNLEQSNFMANNLAVQSSTSQEPIALVPNNDSGFFDFKNETPVKQPECDFFNLSTLKKDIIDTPAFNRFTDQPRKDEGRDKNLLELLNYQSPQSDRSAANANEEPCTRITVPGTIKATSILLPAAVYVSSASHVRQTANTSFRIEVQSPNVTPRGDQPITVRYISPAPSRRETDASDYHKIDPRSSQITHESITGGSANLAPRTQRSNFAPSVLGLAIENQPGNNNREPFASARPSAHFDGQTPTAKEIYLSPVNYKKAQESSRVLGDVSAFNDLEQANEIVTYNYEVYNTGQASRRYVVRRNSSQSILQPQTSRVSGMSSRVLGDQTFAHAENRSQSPVPDTLNEQYIKERYGQVKLRIDNPRFQVYRHVEADVEHLRSRSQNAPTRPARPSPITKAIEAKF